MAQPNDPPPSGLIESVFNALRPMEYDRSSQAFDDGGDLYYLMVQKRSGGKEYEGEWIHATDAEGPHNPRGLIPKLTYAMIHNGEYDDGIIRYDSKEYKIRLARDASGAHIAEAVEV